MWATFFISTGFTYRSQGSSLTLTVAEKLSIQALAFPVNATTSTCTQ
jgi:hypothetical protein